MYATLNNLDDSIRRRQIRVNNRKVINSKTKVNIQKILLHFLLATLTVYTVCGIIEFYNIVNASDINGFKFMLESGIFRDNGEISPLVSLVMRIISVIIKNILPIMSIVSITWLLINLISTVLYLARQPYFDEVYIAKKAYKAEKQQGSGVFNKVISRDFKGIYSGNALKTHGFVKCILMPDLKSLAFYEATDQPMTIGDFLKQNAFRCILMIAFCVMIGDQTLIDLYYQGGNIGVYFFKKLAYDYDYVQIIDNFVTMGNDYKPSWDTSFNNTEGRNKTKVYDEAYKVLKTGCKTKATQTSEFKASMGIKLMEKIENLQGVHWDRKKFVVSGELLPNTSNVKDVPGESYYFNVEEFGFSPGVVENMSGYVHIKIASEDDIQNSGIYMTTEEQAWTVNGNQAVLDIANFRDLQGRNVAVDGNPSVVVNVLVSQGDKKEMKKLTVTPVIEGSKIKITIPQGELVDIAVSNINIKSTDGDNLTGVKKVREIYYKAKTK